MNFTSYSVFSDLEDNWGIHFFRDGEEFPEEVKEHPKTKARFTREEAYAYAESILNPADPKTKEEFFSKFSDDDFEKYITAKLLIEDRFMSESRASGGLSEKTRREKSVLSKIDILSNFDFTERDIETLKGFCEEFGMGIFN